MPDPAASGLSSLEALLTAQNGEALPPVDSWNPPYCGDIGLKIASNGLWFYQGSPIGRMPLVRLFARVLRRDRDGRFYLVTPAEKVDVQVDDAPFLAVEMQVEGSGREQRLTFRTNVDDIVRCSADNPIRFALENAGGGLKPYLRVRGRLEALLTRAIYYDLVEIAVAENQGGLEHLGIWSSGTFFALEQSA